MIKRSSRDTNTPRFRQGLQSGRDVHAIAVNFIPFLDDISQVDADAELHPAVLRQFGIAGLQLLLHSYGALDSVHHAAELSQHGVSGGIHHPAAMLPDEPIHNSMVDG